MYSTTEPRSMPSRRGLSRRGSIVTTAIILVVLLTRFAFGASVGYCGHGSAGAERGHPGHHIDIHIAHERTSKTKALHHSCEVCHAFGLLAIIPQFDTNTQTPPRRVKFDAISLYYQSTIAPSPDRPQWFGGQ